MRAFAMPFVLVLLLATTACAKVAPVEFEKATITVGEVKLKVQVAQTPTQLERGLMYVTNLKPYDGMLFVFPAAQPVAFWMQNTKIPLDVGYFDEEGTLVEIYAMKPMDTTAVPSRCQSVKWALELPMGGFAKKGLKIGQKLVVSSI